METIISKMGLPSKPCTWVFDEGGEPSWSRELGGHGSYSEF
ncbi:MAG: hypothetical protein ACI9UA_004863, partial [Pseudoalteromonas tetraodonis]